MRECDSLKLCISKELVGNLFLGGLAFQCLAIFQDHTLRARAAVSLELLTLSVPSQCCSRGSCCEAQTLHITGGPKPSPAPATRDPPPVPEIYIVTLDYLVRLTYCVKRYMTCDGDLNFISQIRMLDTV